MFRLFPNVFHSLRSVFMPKLGLCGLLRRFDRSDSSDLQEFERTKTNALLHRFDQRSGQCHGHQSMADQEVSALGATHTGGLIFHEIRF